MSYTITNRPISHIYISQKKDIKLIVEYDIQKTCNLFYQIYETCIKGITGINEIKITKTISIVFIR